MGCVCVCVCVRARVYLMHFRQAHFIWWKCLLFFLNANKNFFFLNFDLCNLIFQNHIFAHWYFFCQWSFPFFEETAVVQKAHQGVWKAHLQTKHPLTTSSPLLSPLVSSGDKTERQHGVHSSQTHSAGQGYDALIFLLT